MYNKKEGVFFEKIGGISSQSTAQDGFILSIFEAISFTEISKVIFHWNKFGRISHWYKRHGDQYKVSFVKY